MLTILFSILAIIMLLVFVIVSLMTGEISVINLHLTAYGFILTGIGYIIELLKNKNDTSADHLKYVLAKHHKDLQADIKSVRMTILKQEERQGRFTAADSEDQKDI